MEPESAINRGGSEDAERTMGNLRDQVSQLETALLAQQALLAECEQRRAMFEDAANERLQVIQHGDELLRSRAEEIQALHAELRELGAAADSERIRLQRAWRENGRGMAELANRERALASELLELRNEGLLHSIIRRLRSLFL